MSATILPLPGHHHITALAWDSTGSRIAATCEDGSLWVWHVPSQKLLFSRTFQGTQLLTVAWDPTGKKLATGSNAGLCVLQAWNGSVLLSHQFRHAVTKVSWSPTGSRFLTVSGREVTIFFESGSQIMEAHPVNVIDAAWRWDGVCIGSICTNGLVKVWDSSRKRMLYTIADIRDPQRLAWDRQDTSLAIGTRDGTVQLRDPDTGAIQHVETLSRRAICTLAWGKPGIVASTDQETTVWDGYAHGKISTMDMLVPECGRAAPHASSVDFAPDGNILATARRGMVYIASLAKQDILCHRP